MTMIDEQTLTLGEARDYFPGRPSTASLWRWCRHGLRGVRLEYVRCGRKIITSREALARFAHRLAELDERQPAPAQQQPPRRPIDQDAAAEAEAAREGI